MFGLFKKKSPTMKDAFIRTIYGANPTSKSADLERSIAIAHEDLLFERVPLSQVKQAASGLFKGPIPYSTHDLAVSTALAFFKSPEYVPALQECQIPARLRVANWVKDGKVVKPLAQSFEEVLYRVYKPQPSEAPGENRFRSEPISRKSEQSDIPRKTDSLPKIRKPAEASQNSSPQPQTESPPSPWAGSNDYLAYRCKFEPSRVRLVLVAESPPESGLYFYNPDGKTSEPLFSALMEHIDCAPRTKEEGLREFQRQGWLLVDATYEPVNTLAAAARDSVIMRDYPQLRDDLEALLPDYSVPIVLLKANVCRLLEQQLTEDGFNVLNKGHTIYFPSHGRQLEFHRQFRAILKLELPVDKRIADEMLTGMQKDLEKKREQTQADLGNEYVTAIEIAYEYGIDPKRYRAALREQNFPWHGYNESWTVPRHSAQHIAMLKVAQRIRAGG
jgi:hypothetical protein